MLSLGLTSKGKRLEKKDPFSHFPSLSMFWCVLPVWEYQSFDRYKILNGGYSSKNNRWKHYSNTCRMWSWRTRTANSSKSALVLSCLSSTPVKARSGFLKIRRINKGNNLTSSNFSRKWRFDCYFWSWQYYRSFIFILLLIVSECNNNSCVNISQRYVL